MKSFLIFDFRLPIEPLAELVICLRKLFVASLSGGFATASNCRAGMVNDLPAAAGREARLKTCKPTFSTIPSLQTSKDLEGMNP